MASWLESLPTADSEGEDHAADVAVEPDIQVLGSSQPLWVLRVGRLRPEDEAATMGFERALDPQEDELTSSLLRDWTEPEDVRMARQRLADGAVAGSPNLTSPLPPKSLAVALDAVATPPVVAPPETPAPKGKGKGKAPPPPRPVPKATPKAGAAKRAPPVRPFARWLDWRSLGADRVANTVFEGLLDAESDLVDLAQLERHFGHRADSGKAMMAVQSSKEVEILSQRRAQNMLIAFRRQALTSELLRAMEDFEFSWLSTETLEVLLSAMPTAEEEKELLGYRGEVSELRLLEQELLPFASLVPSAQQRLRLALLQRDLCERAQLLRRRLVALRAAAEGIRNSGAFQQTLQHVLLLGNALNGGDEVTAAQGFSLEALARLPLSKATSDPRVNLLHLLVLQMKAADPRLPEKLLEDLAPMRVVASLPLPQLSLELRSFAADVTAAKAVLRRAFPGFDSPQQFFIGDTEPADGEEEETRVPPSNGCIAQHLLREVYLRISQAPPKPMKQMASMAAENAEQLQVDLAETRDEVSATLSFFAVLSGASASDVAQLDVKAEEFFLLLKRFLSDFEQCVQELPRLDLAMEEFQGKTEAPDEIAKDCSESGAPDADPAEASRSWLEAAGFDPKDVREALAEAEDEDEAFARLQKRQLAAQEARLRPSKRGFEVDGYCCTADANPKRIRLLLPALDLAGPVVGRIQKDGSMTVEIDEWAQELYFASLPRAVVPSDTTFRREEVDLALSQRRPYIWEDFATTEEVKKAHSELEALRERGVLTSANSDTTGKQKAEPILVISDHQ
eukprot:s776_g7.t1